MLICFEAIFLSWLRRGLFEIPNIAMQGSDDWMRWTTNQNTERRNVK